MISNNMSSLPSLVSLIALDIGYNSKTLTWLRTQQFFLRTQKMTLTSSGDHPLSSLGADFQLRYLSLQRLTSLVNDSPKD